MLWIGLYFPLLSLESFAATLPVAQRPMPTALVDAHRIVAANAAARSLGVKRGLKRATALAIAPHITLAEADAARDVQALTAAAHVALAFTPSVHCELRLGAAPSVLLEVQASLRYFGGAAALMQRLRSALAPLDHRVKLASAPTAQGAALLARLRDDLHCADLAALTRTLDPAPVWLLGPGREHWDALEGMGLRTVGELRRMPRGGLARRFGEVLLDELDRALGQRPDPRVWLTLPDTFESRLELFALADTTEQVLSGAGVLLQRLVAWARAQHAQVRRFSLRMQHEPRRQRRHDQPDTPAFSELPVALAEPSCDSAHLLLLLRERLGRRPLPAATLELRLYCADVQRSAAPNTELFPTPRSEHEGLIRLIERLQARLGDAQVQRLQAVQDHRPERSSIVCTVDASVFGRERAAKAPSAKAPAAPPALPALYTLATRPVWLLPQPEPLPERDDVPLLQGRELQLLCGPERIESGWWDRALAERDYYIAQTDEGALVWLYRSRLPQPEGSALQGWFLHGRFA